MHDEGKGMSMSILESEPFREAASALAETVRFLAVRGWTPATSSNFSVRPALADVLAISRSGVDKYAFGPEHVIAIDTTGTVLAPEGAKPSAETLLHTELYARDPEIGAVLHTHSPAATVLSMTARDDEIAIAGFELLKGLRGNPTHDHTEHVPVVANSQDMVTLAETVSARLDDGGRYHGYLIAGHGLYTWGRDLAEARRHVETFEFLFDCLLKMR